MVEEEEKKPEEKNMFLYTEEELNKQIDIYARKYVHQAMETSIIQTHLFELICIKGIREAKKGGLID